MIEAVFSLTIILIIIVAYWSLAVFPKQREYKKHIQYLNTIQVGDEIITFGGIIGRVVDIDDEIGVARLQIADGVEIRILTAALNRAYDPKELARNLRMAKGLPLEETTAAESMEANSAI